MARVRAVCILGGMSPDSDTDALVRTAAIVASLGAALFVAVFALRLKRRERERRVELWRKFALDNRLQFKETPASWRKHGSLSMSGRIGEIELLLETYQVRVGKSHQTWVRAHSTGPGPRGRFSIQRRNLLTRLGGLFGMRGVSLGSPEFDEKFLVRCDPAQLASELLEADSRKHFARLTQSPRLEYADGNIELNWRCGAETSAQLDDAVEMHARLRGAFHRADQRGVR